MRRREKRPSTGATQPRSTRGAVRTALTGATGASAGARRPSKRPSFAVTCPQAADSKDQRLSRVTAGTTAAGDTGRAGRGSGSGGSITSGGSSSLLSASAAILWATKSVRSTMYPCRRKCAYTYICVITREPGAHAADTAANALDALGSGAGAWSATRAARKLPVLSFGRHQRADPAHPASAQHHFEVRRSVLVSPCQPARTPSRGGIKPPPAATRCTFPPCCTGQSVERAILDDVRRAQCPRASATRQQKARARAPCAAALEWQTTPPALPPIW